MQGDKKACVLWIGLTLLWLMGAGWGANPNPQPPDPELLTPRPGPGNHVLPLFQKPFAGDFPLTNFFDHNLPFQFEDNNGFQLTWWGERTQGIDGHNGYDWVMPEGTPLLAVADGEVLNARTDPPFFCPSLGRRVNNQRFIEILHQDRGEQLTSVYVHLSRFNVREGQRVRAGDVIGFSGNTGCSTEPHLHFHVWRITNPNGGEPARIDPYGWEGSDDDPWANHPQGAPSLWLWKEGEAPRIFREVRLPPNPQPTDHAPVALTVLRWMGWKDEENPNNEFVELTLDPRFAPTGSFHLTGFSLRNNRGDAFRFPPGFVIRRDHPVRIYTGSGEDTETRLFWGRGEGVWDNRGDCAHLVRPDGSYLYLLSYGEDCR